MPSTMSSTKRLIKELAEMVRNPLPNCSAGPIDDSNMFEWEGTIVGPEDTSYAGECYNLSIQIPTNYPFMPPHVIFTTKIRHQNIRTNGEICLDILNNKWSPALTVSKVLLSIISMLAEQSPRNALLTRL